MQKLSEKEWKPFQIDEEFDIKSGVRLESRNRTPGERPFIGALDNSNGVVQFVGDENASLDSNFLGVNYNGNGMGIGFYHPYECICTDDVKRFHQKHVADSEELALFDKTVIEKQRGKFGYLYKFNAKRMAKTAVLLPVDGSGEPDYDYMAEYTEQTREKLLSRYREYVEKRIAELGEEVEIPTLNEKSWQNFSMNEIFVIGHGFYNKKPPMYADGEIPFIGATDSHNGVTGFTHFEDIERCSKTGALPNEPIERKLFHGCSIGVTNNGSVGYAYYQPTRFTCTHDVNSLYFRKGMMSEPLAHFLCVCIHKQAVCFEYARKWRPKRMVYSKFLLPVNDSGKPDYEYMEQYAKNMMLRKYKQFLKFIS